MIGAVGKKTSVAMQDHLTSWKVTFVLRLDRTSLESCAEDMFRLDNTKRKHFRLHVSRIKFLQFVRFTI